MENPKNVDNQRLMPPSRQLFSRQQPLWHLFALSILTMSVYPVVWFYKTLKDLSAEAEYIQEKALPEDEPFSDSSADKDPSTYSISQLYEIKKLYQISPLLRTIGLLVPVLDLYLLFNLFKSIIVLQPANNSFAQKHSIFTSIFLALITRALTLCVILKGAFYMLCFLNVLPLLYIQHLLNNFWKLHEREKLEIRYHFSAPEFISMVIGSVIIGLILMGFFVLPESK